MPDLYQDSRAPTLRLARHHLPIQGRPEGRRPEPPSSVDGMQSGLETWPKLVSNSKKQ